MLATIEKITRAPMTTVLVTWAIVKASAQVNSALFVTVKMYSISKTLTRGQASLPFCVQCELTLFADSKSVAL